MSLFEQREQAFERLFVNNEEARFRAQARRNRKLAEWASDRMNAPPEDREAYVSFIVRLGAWFGEDGVRERILHDLQRAGNPVSQHRLSRMMDELLDESFVEAS